MPVCCSMMAWACLAERGGCFRKYSSREVLVLDQGALGLMPAAATQARQAALEVLVEVALDGATGDVGVGGDVVVGQAVALEPEDLHLALDAGVGVMIPVVGQPPVVCGEGDDPHDRSTRCCSQVIPRQQFTPRTAALQFVPDPAAPVYLARSQARMSSAVLGAREPLRPL